MKIISTTRLFTFVFVVFLKKAFDNFFKIKTRKSVNQHKRSAILFSKPKNSTFSNEWILVELDKTKDFFTSDHTPKKTQPFPHLFSVVRVKIKL